ncbi:hypothetical protein [Sphingopyxis sp. H115]|uniref:hypothetical protein n=1 Tax=Sphingopyxis sp. H115 TaxID=1759073 RepID=UPI000AFC4CAE|nr:hypothetical protein [Sphingopyxis sp. H115]
MEFNIAVSREAGRSLDQADNFAFCIIYGAQAPGLSADVKTIAATRIGALTSRASGRSN